MHKKTHLFALSIAFAVLSGCNGTDKTPGRIFGNTDCYTAKAAEVNGRSICETELALYMRSEHGQNDPNNSINREQALNKIIHDEILAAEADRQGLTGSKAFRAQQDKARAHIRALERRAAADLLKAQLKNVEPQVAEAEIDDYLQEHRTELAEDYHLLQIMYRKNEAAIFASNMQLESGTPFTDVARLQFATIPDNTTPWDLGFVHWSAMPPEWHGVLSDLAPGQSSGIIRSPKGRTWLIHLVERRPSDLDSADLRDRVSKILKRQKRETQETTELERLQQNAVVHRY